MDHEDRYTRVEYERRFLVAPDAGWRENLEPYSKTLDDRYLRGTRLRLRIITNSDAPGSLIKLTKKLESDSPYYQTISRILLTPLEYELLSRIQADTIRKIRHYHRYLGRVFSIDVFEGELEGLILCETEADDLNELMSVKPPPYITREVTEDPFFTGGNLCRATREEVLERLNVLTKDI